MEHFPCCCQAEKNHQQKALLLVLVSLLHGDNSKFKISSDKQDAMFFPQISGQRLLESHSKGIQSLQQHIKETVGCNVNNFKSFG